MPNAPVVIHDGSFKIQCHEPLDLEITTVTECESLAPRPYKYKYRGKENHIGRVVILAEGEPIFTREFKPRECSIEIYWSEQEEPTAQE